MPRAHINGVNLHYEVSGQGRAIVLCHGYTASHQVWVHQLPVLAGDYQVVTVDLRGHGSSDAPSSVAAYSIPTLASDIRYLLEHLGISACCFVGHSLGGFVALQLALDHPQLIGALVLVGTSSGPIDIPGYAELRMQLEKIVQRDGMEAAFEHNALHNPMARKRFEKFPELRQTVKRRMLETSLDGYIYAAQAMSQRPVLTGRLGEISAPTLVVVGEEDNTFRQPSEILANGIPHARLHVVPEATHTPQEETPEVFNKMITGFLAEEFGGDL